MSRTDGATSGSDDEINSTDSVLSSSDEEDRWREKKPSVEDLPDAYWVIQKLFRYVKSGNTTTTWVALCCIRDYDLTQQVNQMAIRDCGGIDILVNLLNANDIQCRLCSLRLLHVMSSNIDIRKHVVDLSIVPSLVRNLRHPAMDLRVVTANVLSNVARVRAARTEARDMNVIQILVDALDMPMANMAKSMDKLSKNEMDRIQLVVAVANALAALFVSQRNRLLGRRFGLIPLVAKLLKCNDQSILVAIMRLCRSCACDIPFRLSISTEKMLTDVIKHLASPNVDVQASSAFLLMACAEDNDIRKLICRYDGLTKLVDVLNEAVANTHDSLIEAATGAIWKCAQTLDNVVILSNRSAFGPLIDVICQHDDNMSILVNASGAIAEMLQLATNRPTFRNALNTFVRYLTSTNCDLLVNTCKALEYYTQESNNGAELEAQDAVRLLWSLLRHSRPSVRIAAAHALYAYVGSSANSGVIVRSFVGGFEILIDLLDITQHSTVLAAICQLISNVAKDMDNLAILSDYGVVSQLAALIDTQDDLLREHLAAAIASCAPYARNCQLFGDKRIVTPLIRYFSSNNWRVHRTTAMALEMLSADIQNCLTMHQNGVAPFILDLIGTDDAITQKAASKCLSNIRNMALDAEKLMLNTIKFNK